MRAELESAERKVVVRHLLTGCPRCIQVTRRLWELGDFSPADARMAGIEAAPLELEEPDLLSSTLPKID